MWMNSVIKLIRVSSGENALINARSLTSISPIVKGICFNLECWCQF